jgi:uncharacterized membrane protein YphA (DoxX/SURF4 family)
MTQIEETPLLHWMIDPPDMGGLAWSEPTALVTQQVLGWLVLAAGLLSCWKPSLALLGALALLQTVLTIAMWRIGDGFALQADFLPVQLLTLFPFATQLVRIVAPLGLLLLLRKRSQASPPGEDLSSLMWLFRWALAIVFVAHGIEALQHNPPFLDLLINTSSQLFGARLSETTARHCLTAIGGLDLAVALACLTTRSPTVACWMAFWGISTAASRIVANGWHPSWHETLTRIPHFGVALAVACWWYLLKSSRSPTELPPDTSRDPRRETPH